MFLRPSKKLKRVNVLSGQGSRVEKFRETRPSHWNSPFNLNGVDVFGTSSSSEPSPFSSPSTPPPFSLSSSSKPVDHQENIVEDTHGGSRYRESKTERVKDWEIVRKKFFEAFVAGETPSTHQCSVCAAREIPLYRCKDCAQWQKLCLDCLSLRHSYPHLHVFEAWKERSFVHIEVETPLWESSHLCSMKYVKTMTVIDEKGRQHKRNIQFCKCNQEAVQLIGMNLWPSTVKSPNVAVSIELMRWLYGLLVESHISVKSFCDALRARSSKHDKYFTEFKVKSLYKILITESFEEFRYFLTTTEHPFDDKGVDCPACFSSSKKIYSFDADFQLVRKSSAGQEWDRKFHDLFFLPQKDVDQFMDNYQVDKQTKKQDCSNFQAGSLLRSKAKNNKLDETALFGCTCRHGYPKYFFSLKHGERLGYAVFLIRKLLRDYEGDNEKLHIMYDIACILKNHLQKHDSQLLSKIILSVPIFHAYGHKMSCQMLYSPRRIEGLGLTDGESVERLWSYLGKFSRITKESTAENRLSILIEGLLHYGKCLRHKLGVMLPRKLEKAKAVEKSSLEALDQLLLPLEDISESILMKWIEDEKQDGLNRCTASKGDDKSAKDEVISLIQHHAVERTYLLDLNKKYSRGQSVSKRLSKQINNCNKKIKDLIPKYNDLTHKQISFDDVKNGFFDTDQDSLSVLKRQAVYLRLTIDRAREEQYLVREEMISAHSFFIQNQHLLIERYNSLKNEDCIMALIVKEGMFNERMADKLRSFFSKYVNVSETIPFFADLLHLKHDLDYDVESEDDYEEEEEEEEGDYGSDSDNGKFDKTSL